MTLGVPSYFFYEYLEEHYIDLLQRVLYRVFGNGVQLKYQVGVVENPKADVVVAGANKSVNAVPQVSAPATHVPDPFKQQVYEELDSQLNPVYNFENYYSGVSNKLARTAGESIAEKPGKTAFNPLFLYGESGVGKTHLVQAAILVP